MSKRSIVSLDRIYNLPYINLNRMVGEFQIPILQPEYTLPKNLISFKDAMKKNDFESYIHFYVEDGTLECLWSNPEKYIERFKNFAGVLTPDFSLYTDMPLAMQIWNTFRSRLVGQIYQDRGIKVIPSVSWSTKDSFDFCFDGIPKNSIVSVSSVGIWRDNSFVRNFLAGLDVMIDTLTPTQIVFYGKVPQFNFKNIIIKQYEITTFQWTKQKKEVNYKERE